MIDTVVETTAAVQSQAALIESEERLRAVLEGIGEAFYALDRDWCFLFASQSALKLWGKASADVIGRPFLDCFPEAVDSEPYRAHQRVMRTGVAERLETISPVLHRWMEVDLAPTPGGGVSVAFRDIDARKQAEQVVRASEARQRALIEGVPQLVWQAVNEGEWTWASPQWTAYTGQTDEASRGWGWLEAHHPEDRENARAAWAGAAGGGPLTMETRIYNQAEHRHRWFQTRATPVRDADGQVMEWLGTSTDIDDLRTYQEQQGVLVAELQHRTRNLLGVVRSIAAQTLKTSDTLDGFRDTFNDRLSALSRVQGLLSRADAEPITLGALLRTELDALGASAASERITIHGPEVRLRKGMVQTFALALHELATNARKYGALADGTGRLEVSWRVYHADAGRRLALEWRERGLDRAHEAESPVSKPGGYGRNLIERALPYVLQARTTYQLGERDLLCTIDLPLPHKNNRKDH